MKKDKNALRGIFSDNGNYLTRCFSRCNSVRGKRERKLPLHGNGKSLIHFTILNVQQVNSISEIIYRNIIL